MVHSRFDFLAGGGIVDRRSFLLAGASFLAASSPGPARAAEDGGDARIGTGVPAWMRAPGKPDVGYGQPVSHESHVQKKPQAVVPENIGFAYWHTPIESQRGAITPSGLHFGVHHNGIPDIDPAQHELVIHGLVERPLTFSVEKLLRYPMLSRILFLECAGNTAANALSPFARDDSCQDLYGQVSGSEWVGVPLRLLLEEAGLAASAKWAIAEGADGPAEPSHRRTRYPTAHSGRAEVTLCEPLVQPLQRGAAVADRKRWKRRERLRVGSPPGSCWWGWCRRPCPAVPRRVSR